MVSLIRRTAGQAVRRAADARLMWREVAPKRLKTRAMMHTSWLWSGWARCT